MPSPPADPGDDHALAVWVRGLRLRYGQHDVLAGSDLDVHPGEVAAAPAALTAELP